MAKQTLWHKLLKSHVFRFVFSAGMGFLVDVSAFYLFYHNILVRHTYQMFFFSVRNFTLSLAISFFMGVIVNFLLTRYIVFNESKLKPSRQFIRFVSVAVIGYFANWVVIKILVQSFDIYPPFARVIAALSLFFASYFVHKVFSFSLSLRHAS
jgi:putative flippase GtrA